MKSTGRISLTGWLVRVTAPLLPRLGLTVSARVLGHLAGAALLLIAVDAIFAFLHRRHGLLLVVTVVVLGLAKAGLRYLEHYVGHWVAFAALQHLRELYFSRLIPQAPATTGQASAEITERATRDIDRIEVFFAHTIPPVISSVLVPTLALTWFGIAVDAGTAWVMAAFFAAAWILPWCFAPASWSAARAQSEARGHVAVQVSDDAQGLREILAFEAQQPRLDSLDRAQSRLAVAQIRAGRLAFWRTGLARILWCAGLLTIVAVGADMEHTALALALFFSVWSTDAGTETFSLSLDAAFAAAARVRAVVEAEPCVADTGNRRIPGSGPIAAQVRGVGFSYPETSGKPTLDNVTLSFPAGCWHYVTGVSGSGKSTLASLLTRGWDVSSGQIELNGEQLPALSLDQLRASVAVVEQRPVFFPGTVASNLRLGAPDAPDVRLWSALTVADLDRLPDGLDTRVGERGAGLSGGQLQRLALARALVMQPRLLVLDEALSQLDAETSDRVRTRLNSLSDRPTTVEITHRTDLIPDSGQVSVVDGGSIVAQGLAGDLRAEDGPFTRLAQRA